MDNITVIVEDYPQEITVQVTTTGITVDQANQIVANTQKVGYTDDLVSNNVSVVNNTAKVGITNAQASDITANNAKVGISTQQASYIATNNAKVSDINHVAIELPNADNTSDINKPISTATQSALNLKVNKTENEINTENIFKSVSFAMDFSDRVVADNGNIESRECVMNEYLKIIK